MREWRPAQRLIACGLFVLTLAVLVAMPLLALPPEGGEPLNQNPDPPPPGGASCVVSGGCVPSDPITCCTVCSWQCTVGSASCTCSMVYCADGTSQTWWSC